MALPARVRVGLQTPTRTKVKPLCRIFMTYANLAARKKTTYILPSPREKAAGRCPELPPGPAPLPPACPQGPLPPPTPRGAPAPVAIGPSPDWQPPPPAHWWQRPSGAGRTGQGAVRGSAGRGAAAPRTLCRLLGLGGGGGALGGQRHAGGEDRRPEKGACGRGRPGGKRPPAQEGSGGSIAPERRGACGAAGAVPFSSCAAIAACLETSAPAQV